MENEKKEQEQKRLLEEQKKSEEVELRKLKTFNYESYLHHLRKECSSFQKHDCPLKCDLLAGKKMNLQEIKTHLLVWCPIVNLECKTC